MAKHTFTTFRYNDENQKLADALFQFKSNKTYAVERMDLKLTPDQNISEFYAVAQVERQYRKKKTDAWTSSENFWTVDNTPDNSKHWQRTAVQLTVGMGIRGDTGATPIIQNLVTFQTWFDNKYNSLADSLAKSIVSDSYDATCQVVRGEWNDNCITDDQVELNPLNNGVGIMLVLAKHLKQEQAVQNQKTIDIFSKVKMKIRRSHKNNRMTLHTVGSLVG
tara:strand:+ start:3753 stop:4415 length:663 start_codon:yes stop_codon:yes gene_type:complete